MSFSRLTLRQRYDMAGGRCECQRPGHGHAGRCSRPLIWWNQGRLAPEGWLAVPGHPLELGGADDPANAEAVCWECYAAGVEAADEGRAA